MARARTPQRMVPVTFADPALLNGTAPAAEVRAFHARNCLALAERLAALPDALFNQGSWSSPARNECGTTACALGWAALSHVIPGLQYLPDESCSGAQHAPTANGLKQSWYRAGRMFFGDRATDELFSRPNGSRAAAIAKLRHIGAELGRG